ncbi:hypothetical protein BSKO_04012 [Bryopsis sp. KO-2023]|nr:hypothetical protein BSKO_04012 [Bryopsis sp. KO-2023]
MFASPGGASQFGGGGFLPLPSQGDGERPTQQQKQGNQTMRALTFAQILKAVEENGEKMESLVIDGSEVKEVKSVCQIMDIQDTHAYTQFRVDDSTGMMLVRQFKGNQLAELHVHNYVEVFGHLRTVDSTWCLMAYSIRPVSDYNMVHHHFLEVIHQHLQFTRGPLRNENNPTPNFPQDSNAVQAGPMGGGSMYGGNPVQPNMDKRENQLSQQLQRLFVDEGGAENPNGLHIDEIMRRLQGNWPRPEVEKLLNTIMMEGKLYNTTPGSYQWCS